MPFRPGDRRESASPGRWSEQAACRGLDPKLADRLFFPGHANFTEMRRAKAICADCPVRSDCLEFAVVTNQEHGIWGGTSERERRSIRRRRRRVA